MALSLMNGLAGLGQGLTGLDKMDPIVRAYTLRGTGLEGSSGNPVTDAMSVAARAPVTAAPGAMASGPVGEVDDTTMGRAQAVYKGLLTRGMDPATALGFAANAVQESGADPATRAGDQGGAHGLMQWRGDRFAGYLDRYGGSTSLNDSLDYIMHELRGPEANAWKSIQASANDPASRAAAVSQYYERPLRTDYEMGLRSSIARRLAKSFLTPEGES